jgi:hypothetical protein
MGGTRSQAGFEVVFPLSWKNAQQSGLNCHGSVLKYLILLAATRVCVANIGCHFSHARIL